MCIFSLVMISLDLYLAPSMAKDPSIPAGYSNTEHMELFWVDAEVNWPNIMLVLQLHWGNQCSFRANQKFHLSVLTNCIDQFPILPIEPKKLIVMFWTFFICLVNTVS
jgi:hypothetical protein